MPGSLAMFSRYKDDQPLRVKLFGLGSAGCNMVEGSQYPTIAFSTSSADIARSSAERKILIGQERLVGIAGAKHSILKHIPSVAGHEIVDVFNNTDLAFMFCGLGGLTGSLGVRLFSSIANAKGTSAIVLAASPFSAESSRRRDLADATIAEIGPCSTLCVEFKNDMLSSLAPNLPISRAFTLLNGIMQRPVIDLCSSMTRMDTTVLKQVVGEATLGRFGLGLARGDDRVKRVVDEALSSPWFDFPLESVESAVAIYSASDPWDKEAQAICDAVSSAMPSARIAWGSYADPGLKERIRVSLIAGRKSR